MCDAASHTKGTLKKLIVDMAGKPSFIGVSDLRTAVTEKRA